MSYCRWLEGDVYMFASVNGGIECCSCKFAPKVKTVFTGGRKEHPFFGEIEGCTVCNGEGCNSCMMHGSLTLDSYDEALEHLQKHKDSGDDVPESAFAALQYDRDNGGALEPLHCACGEIAMLFSFDGKPPKCIECGLEKADEKTLISFDDKSPKCPLPVEKKDE